MLETRMPKMFGSLQSVTLAESASLWGPFEMLQLRDGRSFPTFLVLEPILAQPQTSCEVLLRQLTILSILWSVMAETFAFNADIQ